MKNIRVWIYFVLTILVKEGIFYFFKHFYEIYFKKTGKKILFEKKGNSNNNEIL